MNIVDTIFRARKSKNPQKADDQQAIPAMLRGLSGDDTTKDEFNRAFLAGVDLPHEEDHGPRMSNQTSKPSDRPQAERSETDRPAAPRETVSRETAVAQTPEARPAVTAERGDGFETSLSRSFQIVEPTEVQGWAGPSSDDADLRAGSATEPQTFAATASQTETVPAAEDLSAAFEELDEAEAARLVEAHAADIRLAEAEAGLSVARFGHLPRMPDPNW